MSLPARITVVGTKVINGKVQAIRELRTPLWGEELKEIFGRLKKKEEFRERAIRLSYRDRISLKEAEKRLSVEIPA